MCSLCYGYGFWAIGQPNPMGEMDSHSMPSYKCPECKNGKFEMDEVVRLYIRDNLEKIKQIKK